MGGDREQLGVLAASKADLSVSETEINGRKSEVHV